MNNIKRISLMAAIFLTVALVSSAVEARVIRINGTIAGSEIVTPFPNPAEAIYVNGSVMSTVSLDDNPSLALQNDADSTSPELAGVETRTVLGLYNPSTHETRLWYMNNNVHVGTVAGPRVPAGWGPVSAADFNGDGHIDVLLFNPTTRQTWIAYLGTGHAAGLYGPTLPSDRQVVATADFNDDGHPDFVLLISSTRQTSIWYMNNNIHIGTALGPTLGLFGPLVAVSDFNGDGKPDYLLARYLTQLGTLTYILYMNNNVQVVSASGPRISLAWFLAGATDFNRDGRADYLLYNWNNQTAILYNHGQRLVGGPRIPSGWALFAP
jgi:FG-GAP-like repeat